MKPVRRRKIYLMKAGFVLFAFCLLLIATGCSQPNKIIKGYAFAREVMPGVKPGVSLNEDGTVTKRQSQPGIQYFIYTETKDTAVLQVKNIWIKGIVYVADAKKIKDIPLAITKDSSNPNRDTLAGMSRLTTWQINVREKISSAGKKFDEPSQLEDPEVLITFLYKNKIQYFPISKLQYLDPLVLQ